jgi:hypothetical protein
MHILVMADIERVLANWNFRKISAVPMGLLQELLSFRKPEVKTSGYNIGRPYGTWTEYFPIDELIEQPALVW